MDGDNDRKLNDKDIITAIKCNQLGVSLAYKNYRMRIYDKTLEALGSPEYFCFMINMDLNKLALRSCGMNDPGAFKNREQVIDNEHVFHCSGLIRYLYEELKWDKSVSYLLRGEYNEKSKIIEFDLKTAARIDIGGKVKK